ncbi:Hypothetical predicted protein [Mytilus galloprovincialis]|uniref:Uncharacterized protein n=1 Tax=Mytilus galloprovincialis TaxID=29158 RepID=A0A8B6ELS3_MYTGA|nr:Hypothetical predicted protein [Mytilus galloprovincialis]
MSDIHYELLKLKLFQQKSLVRLWKIMLVDFMKFEPNSSIIPNELQMEVENREYDISSIVYAYFLKYLCHHHLNIVKLRQDCFHTLQLVIAENYCVEGEMEFKFVAYNILGIALQMSGDHEAAQQAFMQSVEICSDHRINTSMKRLSLMSSL